MGPSFWIGLLAGVTLLLVLVLWSAIGFATGLCRDYTDLLWCRTLLGLFEGGHWPCAVKTTVPA